MLGRPRQRRAILLVLAGLLAGLLPARPAAAATLPAGFTDEFVAAVPKPTALTFTPDGRMLVTTQPGALRIYQDGSLLREVTGFTLNTICSNSERGLLGVAADPYFTPSVNNFIYLYYTASVAGTCRNRVSRFTLSPSPGNAIGGETVLIDDIPNPGGNHNGGDVHFGKDGLLYVSVGDGGSTPDTARDPNALTGKILRVARDGSIPIDNPFASGVGGRREVFALGLRNPFRIAFDPNAAGTRFFINDVGQSAWEEIDEGQSGADYGWNECEGSCDSPQPGVTEPIYEYPHTSGCRSITGGAFVPSGVWPAAYTGAYLFSDFVCGKIFVRSSNGAVSEFATGLGADSAVHLAFGPANGTRALYYTTYAGGGQVRRIDGPVPAPQPRDCSVYTCWASLGGLLTDSPAAASHQGRLYAFARGSDGALYAKASADGATYGDWTGLGGFLTAAPAAASHDGRLYVFARGTDDALYYRSSGDGLNFSRWVNLGGRLTAAPAAASVNGTLYVFARGTDYALYVKRATDGANFGDWVNLGGFLNDAPAAAGFGGQMHVFARGSDDALYVKRLQGGTVVADWASLGGALTAAPAAASAAGQLAVFARGSDGALYERRSSDGARYGGWSSLGGAPIGAPAATGFGGRFQVFARGSGDALYERHTR